MQPTRPTYCLFCYAPMEHAGAGARVHGRGASQRCPRCGEINLREDRRSHWTREKRLVRLEGKLKLVALFVAVALAFPLLFLHRGLHGFAGVGYAIGAPIVVGFILWDAATLVTARRALLRHDLIWPLLPVTLVVGPLVLFGGIGLVLATDFVGLERFLDRGLPFLVVLLAVASVASLGIRSVVKRMARRRESYLSRRIEAAAA